MRWPILHQFPTKSLRFAGFKQRAKRDRLREPCFLQIFYREDRFKISGNQFLEILKD